MADAGFVPYWRPLGPAYGPNSWIFFILAKIDGCHRPLAAVSSTGTTEEVESLHGPRLVACCRRIVTIFSDPANHTAIRSEMALAESYFAEGGDGRDLESVELPELNRKRRGERHRRWDEKPIPFPFITTALLHGVGFDPMFGASAPARPEPLATVWRDTDIEWGTVVLDITNLGLRSVDAPVLAYGIVGFKVGMAKYIPSREADFIRFQGASFQGEEGPLRVIEEDRPRRAMSAIEYMAKFEYQHYINEYNMSTHNANMEFLASIPLVENVALRLVWPDEYADIYSPVKDMPVRGKSPRSLKDHVITSIIQETHHMDDIDLSILDSVRSLPGFTPCLRRILLQQPERIGNTRAAGRLLQLAFVRDGHLGLEQLKYITPAAISGALDNETIVSLGLCLDRARGTPAQVASSLLQAHNNLREVCLLQSPSLKDDELTLWVIIELYRRPEFLSRVSVMFASVYAIALHKDLRLTTGLCCSVPLEVFPVQQIFIQHREPRHKYYDYMFLGEGLLKPERFAAGFLLWLSTLEPREELLFDQDTISPAFSFSSAPASLAQDPVSAAQVSPMLCEYLVLPLSFQKKVNGPPCARNLDPRGWSVLVTQDANPSTNFGEPRLFGNSKCIRYAFVRARDQPILVRDPPSSPLGPEQLEVLSLQDFLSATTPEFDQSILVRRDIMSCLELMSHSEAASTLHEHLRGDPERLRFPPLAFPS